MTTLDEYQRLGQLAQPQLAVTHYTEFEDSHDLVLMSGQPFAKCKCLHAEAIQPCLIIDERWCNTITPVVIRQFSLSIAAQDRLILAYLNIAITTARWL